MMRVELGVISCLLLFAMLTSCETHPTYGDSPPKGQLEMSLNDEEDDRPILASIIIRDVHDPSSVFLLDCTLKPFLLNGLTFCDKLLVLPPGVYEIIVQPADPMCVPDQDHYKVLIEPEATTEIPVHLVCHDATGALDVVVTQENDGEPPIDGQGCTPGYWKTHEDSWVGYATGDLVDDVFVGFDEDIGELTLLEALGGTDGRPQRKLARHGVAALLNAAHPDVDYPLTVDEVIESVETALEKGDPFIEIVKDALDRYNNLGCPLNSDL